MMGKLWVCASSVSMMFLVTRHLIGEIKCVVPFLSFLVLGNEGDFIGKGGSCQNDATAVPPLRNRCA